MPTEIADSDGESELNSPAKTDQFLPKHPSQTQQSAASNELGVHFSDFLSQEQQPYEEWRLRSPNRRPTARDIGVEPKEILNGIGDEASPEKQFTQHDLRVLYGEAVRPELAAVVMMPTTSRKRRHSTCDNGEDAGELDHTSAKRRRRSGAETYGNSSGRQKLSADAGFQQCLWERLSRVANPQQFWR